MESDCLLGSIPEEEKTFEVCAKICINMKTHTFKTVEFKYLPVNDVGFNLVSFMFRLECSGHLHSWNKVYTHDLPEGLCVQRLYDQTIMMTSIPSYVPVEYSADQIVQNAFIENKCVEHFPENFRTFGVCYYAYKQNETASKHFPAGIINEITKYKNMITATTPGEITTEYNQLKLKYSTYFQFLCNARDLKTKNLDDKEHIVIRQFLLENLELVNIDDLEGMHMTGATFKKLLKNSVLIKLFTASHVHNTMIFNVGLNTDPNKFSPSGTCSTGGIYFVKKENYKRWIDYGNKQMREFSLVSIPNDAQVYIEGDKFKTDKLYVVGFRNLDVIDQVLSNI
jgi:hypothetical protein